MECDAIAVICDHSQVKAFKLELESYRSWGRIPQKTLLVVAPTTVDAVGSGGGILNALVLVSQELCAAAGYSDINSAFLATQRICIIDSGGASRCPPVLAVRGKLFAPVGASEVSRDSSYATTNNTSVMQSLTDVVLRTLTILTNTLNQVCDNDGGEGGKGGNEDDDGSQSGKRRRTGRGKREETEADDAHSPTTQPITPQGWCVIANANTVVDLPQEFNWGRFQHKHQHPHQHQDQQQQDQQQDQHMLPARHVRKVSQNSKQGPHGGHGSPHGGVQDPQPLCTSQCLFQRTDFIAIGVRDDEVVKQIASQGKSFHYTFDTFLTNEAEEGKSHRDETRCGAVLRRAEVVRPIGSQSEEAEPSVRVIDSGILVMGPRAMAILLTLHNQAPFEACTFLGRDNGSEPFNFQLFRDLIPVLCRELHLQKYMNCSNQLRTARELLGGLRGPGFTLDVATFPGTHIRRLCTLDDFSSFLTHGFGPSSQSASGCQTRCFLEYGGCDIADSDNTHSTNSSAHNNNSHSHLHSPSHSQSTGTTTSNSNAISPSATIVDSMLLGRGTVEHGAIVENCRLMGHFTIRNDAVVSCLRSISGVECLSNVVMHQVYLDQHKVKAHPGGLRNVVNPLDEDDEEDAEAWEPHSVHHPSTRGRSRGIAAAGSQGGTSSHGIHHDRLWVLILFGRRDSVNGLDPVEGKEGSVEGNGVGTFCNRPWETLFKRHLGVITPSALWGHLHPQERRTLANARLFPVLRGDQRELVSFLQHEEPASQHTLRLWANAHRISLSETLALADPIEDFKWRRWLASEVDILAVERLVLTRTTNAANTSNLSSNPTQHRAVMHGRGPSLTELVCRIDHKSALLRCLDKVAASSPPDIAARALYAIAEVLAAMPNMGLQSRNGPSRNPEWEHALSLLPVEGEQATAIRALAAARQRWLSSEDPNLIMRAARHYEGAAQRLIRRYIECDTHKNKIPSHPASSHHSSMHGLRSESNHSEAPRIVVIGEPIKFQERVRGTAPARIDFAGGWSDTPPICYEHGGTVVNVAVLLDGKSPIGCTAQLLPSRNGVCLEISNEEQDGTLTNTVQYSHLNQLNDYANPGSPGSLVKCVLLAMGVVDLTLPTPLPPPRRSLSGPVPRSPSPPPPPPPLSAQLTSAFRKDNSVCLVVKTWCRLPRGTGLGVSSILAAVVVAVIARALGLQYTEEGLVHVVLMVEQLMTTGGGWQDQVGGALPSVKRTVSRGGAKFTINPFKLDVAEEKLRVLENHMLLVDTGCSRLARNLLHNVLRRWYQGTSEIVRVVEELVANTRPMEHAIVQGDIAEVGRCLEVYWKQKQLMASPPNAASSSVELPVEPEHVRALREEIGRLLHGSSLCGAGGGGFMVLITKEPVDLARPKIQKAVDKLNAEYTDQMTLLTATICRKGLEIAVE